MLKKYYIPRDRKSYEGYAYIVIDTDTGFFATVSDYGNYAYRWTHTGVEFRKFLIGLEPDYLHGKLMHGRPNHEVFDGDKTYAAVKDAIEQLKSEEGVHEAIRDERVRGEVKGLYEAEKELLEEWKTFNDRDDFEQWADRSDLGDVWEYAKTVPEPQCRAFCEKVMPRLKKLLEEELAQEEKDKTLATEIRAAAPAVIEHVRAELRKGLESLVGAPNTRAVQDAVLDAVVYGTTACSLCGKSGPTPDAHLHQDTYIGECCWDERLKATE